MYSRKYRGPGLGYTASRPTRAAVTICNTPTGRLPRRQSVRFVRSFGLESDNTGSTTELAFGTRFGFGLGLESDNTAIAAAFGTRFGESYSVIHGGPSRSRRYMGSHGHTKYAVAGRCHRRAVTGGRRRHKGRRFSHRGRTRVVEEHGRSSGIAVRGRASCSDSGKAREHGRK
ncbi:hypothetical protein GGX14DRAFT_391548 [Mycena pura]|uniref:Uncharacterized protein n=1 Tax=Mycena pura TaxID=153505 RepID=A0AAD6VLL5_9AGAR|nr:hypothetical protein GGX14DRAFT_391548 [Mycena pura]